MMRARELLTSDHWTVNDVANTLGYRYPNDFSRAFKRFTGVSPTGNLAESCRGEGDRATLISE